MSVRVLLIGGEHDGKVYEAKGDQPPPRIDTVSLAPSWPQRLAPLDGRQSYEPVIAGDGRRSIDDQGRYRYELVR